MNLKLTFRWIQLCIVCKSLGAGVNSQLRLGERRRAPWTGHKSITVLTQKGQTTTHTRPTGREKSHQLTFGLWEETRTVGEKSAPGQTCNMVWQCHVKLCQGENRGQQTITWEIRFIQSTALRLPSTTDQSLKNKLKHLNVDHLTTEQQEMVKQMLREEVGYIQNIRMHSKLMRSSPAQMMSQQPKQKNSIRGGKRTTSQNKAFICQSSSQYASAVQGKERK